MEWRALGLTSVVDPRVKAIIEESGGIFTVSCVCACGEPACRRYGQVELFSEYTVLPGAGCVIPRCKHQDHPAGYQHIGIYELGKNLPVLVMWRNDAHQHGRLSIGEPREVRDRWHRLRLAFDNTQATAPFAAK